MVWRAMPTDTHSAQVTKHQDCLMHVNESPEHCGGFCSATPQWLPLCTPYSLKTVISKLQPGALHVTLPIEHHLPEGNERSHFKFLEGPVEKCCNARFCTQVRTILPTRFHARTFQAASATWPPCMSVNITQQHVPSFVFDPASSNTTQGCDVCIKLCTLLLSPCLNLPHCCSTPHQLRRPPRQPGGPNAHRPTCCAATHTCGDSCHKPK